MIVASGDAEAGIATGRSWVVASILIVYARGDPLKRIVAAPGGAPISV